MIWKMVLSGIAAILEAVTKDQADVPEEVRRIQAAVDEELGNLDKLADRLDAEDDRKLACPSVWHSIVPARQADRCPRCDEERQL